MSEHEQAMKDAAAALTASFVGPEATDPEPVAVEAEADVVSEQPAAEEAAPAAPFDLNPELPEDIAAELAEAEVDDEVEAEVAAYEPELDDYGQPVEDTDAVRERIKLQKRVEFLEKQVVQTKAGQWRKEAEQYFPLAAHSLDDIATKATSRRKYLALAKAEHERILPHIQGYLAKAKVEVDAEKSDVKDVARAEVKAAWGDPISGPDAGVTDNAAYESRIVKARGTGRLTDVFREMLKG
jgi:hypothetical protein